MELNGFMEGLSFVVVVVSGGLPGRIIMSQFGNTG
jgi:hypothetical protein